MKAAVMRAALLSVWLCTPGFADLSTEEFFAQYEPAAKKLRAFYNRVTIEGVYAQAFVVRGGQTEQRLRYRFSIYADGPRLRADLTRLEGNESKPLISTVVSAPEKSFAVSRDEPAQPFVLQALRPQGQSPPDGTSIRLRLYAAFCPYADMDGVTFLDRFKDDKSTILGIAETQQNGEQLVTVSARFRLKPPSGARKDLPEWTGSYTFFKSKGWALQSSERKQPNSDVKVTCNVAYGESVDSIPLLKVGEFWRVTPTMRVRIAACEVVDLKPGPVASEKFTLAAFGIHDVGEVQETRYWLYLVLAGAVLIAAAFVISRVRAGRGPSVGGASS